MPAPLVVSAGATVGTFVVRFVVVIPRRRIRAVRLRYDGRGQSRERVRPCLRVAVVAVLVHVPSSGVVCR